MRGSSSAIVTAVFVPPMSTPTSMKAPCTFLSRRSCLLRLLFECVHFGDFACVRIHAKRLDLKGMKIAGPLRVRETKIDAGPACYSLSFVGADDDVVAVLSLLDRRNNDVRGVHAQKTSGLRQRAGVNALINDRGFRDQLFGLAGQIDLLPVVRVRDELDPELLK